MSAPLSHGPDRPQPDRIRGRKDFADDLTALREQADLTESRADCF